MYGNTDDIAMTSNDGVLERGGTLSPPPTPPRFYGLFRFQKNPPEFIAELHREHGDVVRWRGFQDVYFVNHPDYARRVLSQPYTEFSKNTIDYRVLQGIMGNGLVTNDGEDWVGQRKLMQPLFNHRIIGGFDTIINRVTENLIERWSYHDAQTRIPLDREMSKLTFEIVGATLFSSAIEQYADEVADILKIVNLHTQELKALLTLYPWIPTPNNFRFKASKRRLDEIVYDMIEARRDHLGEFNDLLDRLLMARDEDSGEGMDRVQIRDEIVTLLLAGHETSANALLWAIYLLGRYRDVEERLVAELSGTLGGRPATHSDLGDLPYLKQVVQESMRVYPPVWAIARRSQHREVFGGYAVPAGAYVGVVQYALHRHPEFWPDPERFDPDRFSPEQSKNRHSYCYLPFAAGPRTCIGAGMAMLEIQLVLAQILQRFRLTVVPGHPIEMAAKVTLNPKYGMPVTLTPRAVVR